MNMLCLLLAQTRGFQPTKVDMQALLTKISVGGVAAGVALLIFYGLSQFLLGKSSKQVRARSSSKQSEQDPASLPATPHSHHHRHHRRHRHSRAAGRRNPTLKEAGGLPPLRPEDTPPGA